MRHPSPQRGFTLVELMVAMTLGLLVSAAVVSLYISTSRNYAEDERYARMQENGRYTLQVLTDDLAMVDFWGKMLNVDTIGTAFTPPAPGSCEEATGIYDATTALFFNNYHVSPWNEQFALSPACNQIDSDRKAGADILVIKRVTSAPTAETFVDVADTDGDGDTAEILTTGASDLQNGTVYLRTNGTSGNFINDASSTNLPGVAEADWRYQPRVYFVRKDFDLGLNDGIPSLCRMDINGTGFAAPECLAQGIEDLHIQFGLDTDGDGIANQYVSDPSPADMEKVVTARVYVLVRSVDVDPTYTDTNTYVLGDVNIASPNDGYYRRVYTSTVALRNPTSLHLLSQ